MFVAVGTVIELHCVWPYLAHNPIWTEKTILLSVDVTAEQLRVFHINPIVRLELDGRGVTMHELLPLKPLVSAEMLIGERQVVGEPLQEGGGVAAVFIVRIQHWLLHRAVQ